MRFRVKFRTNFSDLFAKSVTEALEIFRIVAWITVFHVIPLDAEESNVAYVN